MIRYLKENEELSSVLGNDITLVDFYADWCGPCKMLAPLLEEIAGEYSYLDIYKINVDEENELAKEFGIMNIPTLLFMRKGTVLKKVVGMSSKKELMKLLSEAEYKNIKKA